MELIIDYADVKEYDRIVAEYYDFYTAFNGPTIFRIFAQKAFAQGQKPNEFIQMLDKNFIDAEISVDDAFYGDKDISVVRISNTDDYVLAYARIKWALAENEKNASVIDVAIAVPMYSKEQAELFYNVMIDEIEKFITDRNEKVNIVTHEVPRDNTEYIDAITAKGDYTFDESNNSGARTYLYDKWVRNKPKVRKQETK